MKYFTPLLFILLFSCKSNQEKSKDINNTDTLKQKSIDTTLTTSNNTDKAKHYTITDISEKEYTHAYKKDSSLYYDYFRLDKNNEETEKYLLKKYSSVAKRNDKKLEIITKAGVRTFINKVSKNSDINGNDSSFFLVGLNKDFVVLQISYYESAAYKVVDLNSGQEINVWGLIYPSPSGKQILSTNIDLEAAFEVNGIQFLIMENGKWKIKWEEELSNWGMKDPLWIDENTILFKEEKPGSEGNNRAYKKISLL